MSESSNTDSAEYQRKQAFFNSLLTIYGRKPVLEALQDRNINFYKLHLAESNKKQGIIQEITQLAEQRDISIQYHDKKALSRISKNSKQDQGVAADIQLRSYQSISEHFKHSKNANQRIIALDRITNPQNLGMIIRSVCAGNIDGLLIPKKGCASLSPLVIKASTGTLFKTPLIYCNTIEEGLTALKAEGATVYGLSSYASTSLFEHRPKGISVYVLGNETEGVSRAVQSLADDNLVIPMNNGVESLNVAITAALIAFQGL